MFAQIAFDDAGVVLHLFHRAFDEHFAFVKHCDRAGDLSDEFHVVFDDNDGVVHGQALEDFAGFDGFFVCHARGRFVDEEEFGVLQNDHCNFEPLFLAVREGGRRGVQVVGQAGLFCDCVDAVAVFVGEAREKRKEDVSVGFEREHQIFVHAEGGEDRGGLKFAPDAGFDDGVFAHVGEVEFVESRTASVGLGFATQHVEKGGFARAVGADDHAQFPVVQDKFADVERDKSVEGDAEGLHGEEDGVEYHVIFFF